MTSLNANLLTSHSLTYTLTHLAQCAGWQDDVANLPFFYGELNAFTSDTPAIIIIPTAENSWPELLSLPNKSLFWLPQDKILPTQATLPFDDAIPVLFWGTGYEDGRMPFAQQVPNGSVVFYADIIAATFFMLSRWEETVVSIRDKHERFPATASVAYKQGFLDRPIVDEYALILREWIKVLRPRWIPKQNRFSLKLSHDIDSVRHFSSLYQATRALGGDVVKRRDLKAGQQTIKKVFTSFVRPQQDSNFQGIYTLADWSKEHGLESAFYFMTADPAPFDQGYDPNFPLVRQTINILQKEGFEVGFHPGYHSLNDPKRLTQEKCRLDKVLGQTAYGGRQHFLRFQVPNTWRHWEQAGLTYDSTMGYADHEGFRCGTCHAFQPFDVEQNRVLDLWEIPLIVMDGTLCHYRKLRPVEGERTILALARKCQDVEGTFTLLWHNSSLDGIWKPWVEIYRCVVKRLALQSGNRLS